MADGLPPAGDARQRAGRRPRSTRSRGQEPLQRPERDEREAAATVIRPAAPRDAQRGEEVERR